MHKELTVPFEDLRNLSIQCECGAQIVVDLSKVSALGMRGCPVCAKDFHSQLGGDLRTLALMYQNAEAVKYKLSFRVPVGERN